ncbi:MAG TPA: hypothetical protein VJQ54_01590, partial [Candidatus Sulfotelmatobacter sp.]|nr:hypothetical protein [Candidatus Sulfotelmatobacter sp.]
PRFFCQKANRRESDRAGSPCVRDPAAATRALESMWELLLEETGVLLDEILLVFRQIFQSVDRVGGAGRNTRTAVDASFGIYVHLGRGFEAGLVGLGVDAVGGANLNTEGVFDASISNYIGHDKSISTNEMSTIVSLDTECKEAIGPER